MTELSPSEQRIYEILSEILVNDFEIPAEKIALDARLYEDFDIDSIDAVDMIVQLKPHLGNRRVTPQGFETVRTLGDVVTVIARVLDRPEEE